jgi:hypothetical protein
LVQCLDIISSTQLCHILHGFSLQYCCSLLIDFKTSYSFQHAGLSYTVITIDAIWKTESFSLSLTNTVIGSDVKINQDSIHGYMGLGFDMSNFNEDGSDNLYTIGISMPIRIVQYHDFFTWSKYSHHLFPNDLSRMILDNVDKLFWWNSAEFLQTGIDGSIYFSLNAINIQSLEKCLKTFYTPPLDIDQISSIWDQILLNPKTRDNVVEEVWKIARKATIFLFSIFTLKFHQCLAEHRFLESTLELLQQFYLQVESIALDYKVFHEDQAKFSLNCLCCGKKNNSYRFVWESFIHGTHGYFSSSENTVIISSVNNSCFIFKNMPVLFTFT